jgi:catecholate siderophore receptor
MFNKTPLAAALTFMFATHLPSALAQAQPNPGNTAPSNTTPASTTPASTTAAGAKNQPAALGTSDVPTLPEVAVSGSADKNDFQADRSSVGAKTPTAIRDIAQSTTVVTKAVMESEGVTSFQDALRNVPGITIGGAEGGQIGNNINLRGFTARTDIYLDGFRDRGQYYRDTFDLESIDVLYGPSSMLFGRGSTGGVVNQVSKKAELNDSGEVSGTVGSDDRYRSTVDLNHQLSDTSAFRIDAFGQSMESTRDVEKNQDYGVAPSLRFGIGTPTEITFSALIEHNDDMPDYGVQALDGHPAPVSRNTFYGLTNDRTIQDVQILNNKIKHKINDNLTIQNQTQFAHYAIDARETAPQSVLTGSTPGSPALSNGNYTTLSPSQLFVQLQSHDRVIDDHSLYNDTDVFYKFDTGFIKHNLDVGIELGRDTYANQAYTRGNLPIVSLLNPVYESTPANVTTTVGNLAQASANTFAGYFNDTLSLGEHWKLVGGVRWDDYRAEISNSISLPAYASQTTTFTSVRAGVIFQPNDWSSYYVSYGTSFDPSLEQLTVTNGTQNLAPETNKSYETGAKWDALNGKLSLNAALFQVEQNNSRTEDSAGEYELNGDVRVRGGQLSATGRLSDKWQVIAGYTYMDALVVKAADGTEGHTPANTPRNTMTLWSTYAFTPAWEAGGGLTYMSSRYAANTDLVEVGGYTRWDAEVAYHQKKYDLRLNLLNLTNKFYYDALIQSDGGRSVPAVGRTVMATATYKF